jgi:tetratricopeptide (TPR) repeat protein
MQTPDEDDSRRSDLSVANSGAYGRFRDLFAQVLDIEESERGAWFAANVTDADEREALQRLLDADRSGEGFLDVSADLHAARMEADDAQRPGLMVGQRIGAFTLTRLVGQGGMAVVFLGEREGGDFEQRVAVKLLRRGLYSDVEQRLFRRERQLLAGLEHPNISRLIDGGITAAGVPYLVIEFVDGAPITHYARNKALSVRRRLELFLVVCRAVEAAHRALIVHRDIKPSNILVSTAGDVKLLDFGIAKLLEEDTHVATVSVFTPDYAAPEQIANEPITTATDVYSLGVLLHELLTGSRPDRDSARKPSSSLRANAAVPDRLHVQRSLRGDLDTIILKCLAPEVAQRYASAGALADDIERYIAGQPVRAHAPSRVYRMRKFAQRHRGGVLIATVVVVAILSGLAIAEWQAAVARQEAERANTVRDVVVSVFQSAGADLPKDKRPTPEDLVSAATARLMAQNDLSAALRSDLLVTLAKVATSAGAYDQALKLLDREASIHTQDTAANVWWDAQVTRAAALKGKAKFSDIVLLLDPLRDRLEARDDEIGINGLILLGDAWLHTGHVDEGLALVRTARETADAHAATLPAEFLIDVSIKEESSLTDAQRFREALNRGDATLALWRRLGAPPRQDIIAMYGAIALDAEATGDIARAEAAYKDAIALGDKFFDKPNPGTAWNVGMYGTFLIAQGRLGEAEPYARRGLEMRQLVFGDDDSRTLNAVAGMGKLYAGQNKFNEAEAWYTKGIDSCRKTALDDVVCPRLLSNRARAYSGESRFGEAEQDIREALALQSKIGGETNAAYAYILDNLAVVQVRQHHDDDAIASADKSLAIYKNVKGGMIQSELSTRFQRAIALFDLKRNDDALHEVSDIEPKYAVLFPQGGALFGMKVLKARALDIAGRHDEARTTAAEALALQRKPPIIDPKVMQDLKRIAGQP